MTQTFFDFSENLDENAEFVIFGIPWDYLTTIKLPNSSIAPDRIRDVSMDLALTTELGFSIQDFKVKDIGNVKIIPENIDQNIESIKETVNRIYQKNDKAVIIMIGGDHFCSYPTIKATGDLIDRKEEFGVLIFDSHLDLYEEWDNNKYSHATISHRVLDLEYISNRNLLIAGTRDIDLPEKEIAIKNHLFHLDAYLLCESGLDAYIQKIIDFFNKSGIKNLYISIDIDALDPSIAPGTGYAIPGGFTYREMWKILKVLASRFKIIAFDVVEVAPNLDLPNNLTCNLAAKLIVELISFIKTNSKSDKE
ncbi:MAG: arginase family protein [Promethearchaeota archaeon]